MKIAYNPKTAAVITTATAANDDILFDLNARKVWAKGIRIGADWADISSKPSSLKNPYALTISLNGTSLGPYDGSATKNINITPGSIGAATSGHNHDGRYLRLDGSDTMAGVLKVKANQYNDGYDGAIDMNNSDIYGLNSIYTVDRSDTQAEGIHFWRDSTHVDTLRMMDGNLLLTPNRPLGGSGTEQIVLHTGNSHIKGGTITINGSSITPLTSLPSHTHSWDSITGKPSSFTPSSHTHTWQSITDKVVAGNEFNIVNAGFNSWLWFNYLPTDNRNSSAAISLYNMGNGNKGLASVYAKRFKVDGQSCMWKDARNYAPFYSTYNGGFEPILDIKTVSGDWSIGSYDSYGNHLVFAYTSDSDFNAGVNGTALYWLSAGGEFKINTLRLAGSTNANMGVGSTNPQIIFAENSATLLVALTYTDWDSYRTSKGLKVHSYDGSDDSNVWFEVLGYNYSSGYVKNGSSDAYVLLGGGGHKPLSELGSGSYLPYNGWWSSGSGLDVNDANGMIFAYANHKNTPFSSAWGIITTFDYTYNSNYKFLLAANGYSNAMYYRSRSNDRGGWTSWALVIDTENIGSLTVANAYHLRINSANTWSTWYWQGQSGQPTWLWGCNDGGNMYVWNPSNFSVKYATSAGSVAWANVTGKPNTFTPSTHDHNYVLDIASNSHTTFAYSKPGLSKDSITWLAVWNGYELRAMNKDQIALADHTHDDRYLKLEGGTMNGNARIGHGSGNLYIGNSGNDGWIYTQDIASQLGTNNWFIKEPGAAHFGNIYICTYSDYVTYSNSVVECYNDTLYLNYYSSRGISLCNGGGNVGIGTNSPSYKLDVNGLMRAGGFHHGSINSDNYILLAGGGYKSYGGSASNHIFLGYLNLYHGNDGTIDSYFYCLGYSVPFTYTRGGNYCKISIPDTTHQVFYIRAAIASVNYSGGGMDTWTGEHRGDGTWWLHCYANGNNEVRVKGFRNSSGDNDSWWGGNPLYSGSGSANIITVCLFGYVDFR